MEINSYHDIAKENNNNNHNNNNNNNTVLQLNEQAYHHLNDNNSAILKNFDVTPGNEDDIKSVKSEKTVNSINSDNEAELNYKFTYKIILIGDANIGKTSIIERYINNRFSEKYICTIGVDFSIKTLMINGTKIKLQIWDTAGSERFRQITNSYYRGSNAAIIVFDLTKKQSFINVKYWLNSFSDICNNINDKIIILVGNKSDLTNREVKDEDIYAFINLYPNLFYMECSALSGNNIEKMFSFVAEKLYEYFKSRDSNVESNNLKLTSDFHRIQSELNKTVNEKEKKCKC